MGHDHHHGPDDANRTRLAVAFGITATILVAQAVGALLTGSLALLVDTAHMLTDAAGRTTDPLVWEPMAPGTMKAATAAAEPLDEPPGVRSQSCGFLVLPG